MATKLGAPWHAAPPIFGWAELVNFATHLPEDSATWRATHPEYAPWATAAMRAKVATDTFDAIRNVGHLITTIAARKELQPPAPYPAPWARKDPSRRTFGRGSGVSVEEFARRYYKDE